MFISKKRHLRELAELRMKANQAQAEAEERHWEMVWLGGDLAKAEARVEELEKRVAELQEQVRKWEVEANAAGSNAATAKPGAEPQHETYERSTRRGDQVIDIVSLPDGVQAALIHRMPDDTAAHRAWCDWARRHGIDPSDVPVPGAIFRDPTNRRVTYAAYERDADGRVVVDVDRAVIVHRTVQLETGPEPFPEEMP